MILHSKLKDLVISDKILTRNKSVLNILITMLSAFFNYRNFTFWHLIKIRRRDIMFDYENASLKNKGIKNKAQAKIIFLMRTWKLTNN